MSSGIDPASPTDRAGAPIADFSNEFDIPVIVTFLFSQKDNKTAGWVDTTVYGYDTDGKTDKLPQDNEELYKAATEDNGDIKKGDTALGQMKFSNSPAGGRKYTWQESISEDNDIVSLVNVDQGSILTYRNVILPSQEIQVSRSSCSG